MPVSEFAPVRHKTSRRRDICCIGLFCLKSKRRVLARLSKTPYKSETTTHKCIIVTLTDGSTYKAGSVSVTKEEAQALKTTAGVATGVAGVSLVGALSNLGYTLLRRKKLF